MSESIEIYKLGNIEVTVTKVDRPNKLLISCFDGAFKAEFVVSEYEFQNYRRLLNQKITDAYKEANAG